MYRIVFLNHQKQSCFSRKKFFFFQNAFLSALENNPPPASYAAQANQFLKTFPACFPCERYCSSVLGPNHLCSQPAVGYPSFLALPGDGVDKNYWFHDRTFKNESINSSNDYFNGESITDECDDDKSLPSLPVYPWMKQHGIFD